MVIFFLKLKTIPFIKGNTNVFVFFEIKGKSLLIFKKYHFVITSTKLDKDCPTNCDIRYNQYFLLKNQRNDLLLIRLQSNFFVLIF